MQSKHNQRRHYIRNSHRTYVEDVYANTSPIHSIHLNDSFPPNILRWNDMEEKGKFSITTVHVSHNKDTPWYLPAQHLKHQWGWNRSTSAGFLDKPLACSIGFNAIGLESTLGEFKYGGTGYLTLSFKGPGKKDTWVGFDKNETSKIHCYYMTNKHLGSEFIDTPKTLGLVINCPVSLDAEIGEYAFRNVMNNGRICRSLSDAICEVKVHLRPTTFSLPESSSYAPDSLANEQIVGEATTSPLAKKLLEFKEMAHADPRPNAVCTVLTFRNEQTGPMLHLFVDYYHRLGWYVIIYDRFGFHQQYVQDFIGLYGVDYHPYTIFQMTQPKKYNAVYASKQSFEFKYFYKMEKNWGYTGSGPADTADQDADKTHTYDHCRVEYMAVDMILFVDIDELFYCPQAASSVSKQRKFQHKIMSTFGIQGVEEMRFVRIPYAGLAPANNKANRSNTDITSDCMLQAFSSRATANSYIGSMVRCWSSATAYDNFPKSADFAAKCPFHYNHWSCDGMKGGGRDWGATIPRCRCKVAFDMINGFEYKPNLEKCHLLHLNDNKYRFQSKRDKHVHDKGDVAKHSPLAGLYETVKIIM